MESPVAAACLPAPYFAGGAAASVPSWWHSPPYFDVAMIPLRPPANDNPHPEDLCRLRTDEVKRRFVAKIACAAREGHPLRFDSACPSDRRVAQPDGRGRSSPEHPIP
jgi:hypothetical protein